MSDLMSKFGGGFSRTINTISSKSKEIVETTKLRYQINEYEKMAESNYLKIGRIAFEMINKDSIDMKILRENCEEINVIYRKINDLKEAIQQAELESIKKGSDPDAIICNKCKASNRRGDNFCYVCGASMIDETPQQLRVCSKCGSTIKEGMSFCGSCGTKVS